MCAVVTETRCVAVAIERKEKSVPANKPGIVHQGRKMLGYTCGSRSQLESELVKKVPTWTYATNPSSCTTRVWLQGDIDTDFVASLNMSHAIIFTS